MKTTRIFILRNSLFVLAILFFLGNLFLGSVNANAQSAADAQAMNAQASSAPIIQPVARITQKINEANLVAMRGTVHPLARMGFDQGLAPDSQPMNNMLLVLQRGSDQEAALRNLIDEQQTKTSTNYHAWLTPQQFAQQFGVAGSDIQQVAGWLAGKGFTGVKVSNGGMFIQFSGTAGLVRNAFHTEIHYVLVNGQLHFANLTDPQIPAALAPVVARIHSLHDFRQKSSMHLVNAMEKLKAQGLLTKPAFGTGTGIFAVGPGDLATIYNIPSTVAGSPAGQGQTVAIVARANITISDINQFGVAFGIPNLTNFSTNNVIVVGPDPGIAGEFGGEDGEATLDIDMVGSTAPNANILLVVNGGTITGNLAGNVGLAGNPTDGVDQAGLYIVDNNLAPVMSQSFGACEAATDNAFANTLWEQAAAQGISVFVSTGDSGSDSCDAGALNSTFGLSVSGSASTPFNIAVGGTDFNDASNPTQFWNNTAALATAKSYIPEIPWNDSCAASGSLTGCTAADPNGLDLVGGSGGQSNCITNNGVVCTAAYPKPSWQSAPGVPADSVRDIPDVSLFASVNSPSNHFYVFCLADSGSQNPGPCNLTGTPSYNFSGVGGTSASTPAWAGIMALVNQSELAAGRGGRQGNANYVFYKLGTAQGATPGTSACAASSAAPNTACTFNDVTIGNNSVECVAGTPNCSNTTNTGFGILVTPGPPFPANTPAFSATAGYDLATGLGTPNVTNLIANWGTVTTNFKTATPAITSPASGTVNITHGNSQSFTITVTGTGGTPTGDVSLIAQPPGFSQVGVGFGTLSGGTVTITTNTLPGDNTTGAGTPYPVIAHYAGDGTFGPADSAPINVTVNRENSTTTANMFNEDLDGALTATSSVQYGTNYIMIVDVVGATAGVTCNNTNPSSVTQIPTVPCPTGTISLTDNGAHLNDFIQTGANNTNVSTMGNLGFVEDLLISIGGGANNIVASYSGDNSYNPSVSTNGATTVVTAPTQTTVSATTLGGAATTTVAAGSPVTLVASVSTNNMVLCNGVPQSCPNSSNGAGPTGTVTFAPCGTASSCTVPVAPTAFNSVNKAAFATGTLTTSFSTAGPQTITATYSGDTNYSPCNANGNPSTPPPGCTLNALALTVSASATSATQLAFVTQPSNAAVGVAIAPPVQVAVEDLNGNVVTTAATTVAIAIGTNPGTGTLGGTVSVAAVKGIATFSNLTLSAAGAGYTLAASATSLTGATSSSFNVVTQPVKLAFIVPPSNSVAGGFIVPAVQVAVQDVNGNLVTTATNSITLAIGTNPGSGTLSGPATTVTASGGIAVFPNLSINNAGTGYTLTASASGLTGATSPAFNVLATASKLAFTVQPSNATAGKSIAPSVQVAVQDSNGNLIGSATNSITIAIGTNPGTGTLGGTATINATGGVATFSNLNISTAGTGYTLTAASTGLTGATSNTFNVTAPVIPSFTLTAAAGTTLSSSTGTAAGTIITVTPAGGFTGTVAVAASALPPGVTCPNSPLNISVTGATAVTGTLNCQVTAHSTGLTASNFLLQRNDGALDAKALPPATPPNSNGGKGWWALSAGTGFAALFFLFIPGGRKRLHAALGLGLICLLTLTLGCSGGGNSGGGGGGGLMTTTTAMTVNATTEPSGTPFTFSVKVTGGTPTGMVQLFDGATMIGTAAAVSGGTAAPTAPALSVGTHAISAHYLGDSTTQASQSGTLNLTSQGSATFTITGTSGNTTANAMVNITVN